MEVLAAKQFRFSPFWEKQPFNFSDLLHKENNSLYLCLNMINLMQWILVSVALKK